jgi:hypothetical protein
MGKRWRSSLPKRHATPVAIAMHDYGAQCTRPPRGQHEGHGQQGAGGHLVRDMAQGAVDRHSLHGEVADHPQPPPPVGGGIVHPHGDGTAVAGAGVARPPRALGCGGAALWSLHRPPFQDHDGAPLDEAPTEDEVIAQHDAIAEGQPVQGPLRQRKLLMGCQPPDAHAGEADLQLEKP